MAQVQFLPDPADSLMQAFQIGLSLRRQREQREMEMERIKLAKENATLQAKYYDHLMKAGQFSERAQFFKMMNEEGGEGQPPVSFAGLEEFLGLPPGSAPSAQPLGRKGSMLMEQMNKYGEKRAEAQGKVAGEVVPVPEALAQLDPELAGVLGQAVHPDILQHLGRRQGAAPMEFAGNLPEIGVEAGQAVEPQEAQLRMQAYQSRAAQARANSALEIARMSTYNPQDPQAAAALADISRRIQAGEDISDVAKLPALLGRGVGKYAVEGLSGEPLLPDDVRKQLGPISVVENYLGLVENVGGQIMKLPVADIKNRAELSLVLSNLNESMGTLVARGMGETGMVATKDAERVAGIIPGWIAANFNPGFFKREMAFSRALTKSVREQIVKGRIGTPSELSKPLSERQAPVEQHPAEIPVGRDGGAQYEGMAVTGYNDGIMIKGPDGVTYVVRNGVLTQLR